MKQLYIKQKVFTLGEKFTVKDADGNDVYFVSGSFFKIPKTFTIINANNEEVATITKKVMGFLPTFYVDVQGHETIVIKKEFTLFKARYSVEAKDIKVYGNLLDMDFQVKQNEQLIGQVTKKWFSWGDSYKVDIFNEEYETIVIAIVIAIDFVKDSRSAAASAPPS